MLTHYLAATLTFFLIGAALLSLFTIWVYRSGAVHRSRHADGTLNTQSAWQGKALSILFLLFIVGFLCSYAKTVNASHTLNFWQLFLVNFILMILLTLFDSFFLDLYVLARWKPAWLMVPEEVTIESMRLHVKKTFQIGWVFLVILSLVAAEINWLIM